MMRPCLDCGQPSPTSRCPNCAPAAERDPWLHTEPSARKRGYTTSWDRLSKRARKAQPWCLHCGATEDLTVHHTEQAWQRHTEGKPLRLADVQVLCLGCNVAAGTTRKVTDDQGGSPAERGSGPRG